MRSDPRSVRGWGPRPATTGRLGLTPDADDGDSGRGAVVPAPCPLVAPGPMPPGSCRSESMSVQRATSRRRSSTIDAAAVGSSIWDTTSIGSSANQSDRPIGTRSSGISSARCADPSPLKWPPNVAADPQVVSAGDSPQTHWTPTTSHPRQPFRLFRHRPFDGRFEHGEPPRWTLNLGEQRVGRDGFGDAGSDPQRLGRHPDELDLPRIQGSDGPLQIETASSTGWSFTKKLPAAACRADCLAPG